MKSSGFSRSKVRVSNSEGASSPDMDARPSILGIWRLGRPFHRSETAELTVAQPADAGTSPRWDYVIKRALRRDDAEACGQIARYAAAAASASHPNLVAVLDASATGAAPYVVMPRLEGRTLDQFTADNPERPMPVLLWIVRQIAQALDALHVAGWVHSDVKPANVIVGPRGHVTLVDLSFATRANTVSPGRFRGTPDYAAPESLVDHMAAMPPIDVYALGRILDNCVESETSLTRSQMAPVAALAADMVSADPQARPSADDVARQLLRLEIETLGQHIGPGTPRRRAA